MLNTPSSKNICVYIVKCLQVLCAYLWGWYCDLEDYRNLIFLLYLSVYFNLFKNKNSFILELGLLIKPEKGEKEASLGPYTVDLKLQDWNEPWVGFANLIPMWEVCVCVCVRACAGMLSHVGLFATLWTVARRLLCPWDYPRSIPHLKNLLCSLFHPGPDLIAKPPECVELKDGIQSLHGLWMVKLRRQHIGHSLRDFHRTQQEHGR